MIKEWREVRESDRGRPGKNVSGTGNTQVSALLQDGGTITRPRKLRQSQSGEEHERVFTPRQVNTRRGKNL